MSYEFAIVDGTLPDDEAGEAFEALVERYVEVEPRPKPTKRIGSFIDVLMAAYPAEGDEEGTESPWASLPLTEDAGGPVLYGSLTWERAEEVADRIVRLAGEHGLTYFDPNTGNVITTEMLDALARPWWKRWLRF